jgi:hypothetical protein
MSCQIGDTAVMDPATGRRCVLQGCADAPAFFQHLQDADADLTRRSGRP